MKQPTRLTREQKLAVAAYDLQAEQWMYLADVTECYIKIIHKENKQIRIIDKYARKVRKNDHYRLQQHDFGRT